MLITLALRHLLVRKLRSLFLLLGFSLGVGVMIVLLSVGEAMLDQSRDVSLIGGGEVTVLPLGIDVEAMRTGGVSGMFFGIDRARFLARQILGGPRHGHIVKTVSPVIEGKLIYLGRGDRTLAVRAGGEIPSRARDAGSGLDLLSGRWTDSPADSAYVSPTPEQLYHEMDRFHLPPRPDSTWSEWHYFNLVTAPDEWWYVAYLIRGEVGLSRTPVTGSRWSGQLLVTHRRPDGRYERFIEPIPSGLIDFDTTGADLTLGRSSVRQRNGRYELHGRTRAEAGSLQFDVTLIPAPNRYFPPVELSDDQLVSGYVVPGLVARASGEICVRGRCRIFSGVPAYHDHNWGVWRDVTWEWGMGQGSRLSLLYGGVYGPEREQSGERLAVTSPFFLALVDSLGVHQVLRFDEIQYQGARTASGLRAKAPARFTLIGTRDVDTVRIEVRVTDALATEVAASRFQRAFLQMRGRFTLNGTVAGRAVADSGRGFFETYLTGPLQ
ncbi:MAG: hypothetical protein ACREMZ_11975 [Gemmatimonadales bacterium]